MIDITRRKERVFLIGVLPSDEKKEHYQLSMEELHKLAETAEVDVIDSFVQSLPRSKTKTYIGKGKLQEIKSFAKTKKVKTLIFNNNLSPAQSRNISNITGCNVVDRTELILHIFAQHARTKQAKLQVEIAQLDYSFSKLKNLWKHLSRIRGGIGFRGPGETQIEIDRREIRYRINILKKQLKELEKTTKIKRKKRSKYLSISLVGYTNAGKSTLFNLLTKEDRLVEDKLFATLDAKSRLISHRYEKSVMLTDTIGFIRKLPHKLVESFKSTLLEVVEADLLLHVIDVNQPNVIELIESVNSVLDEINASKLDIIMVFNKCDLDNSTYFKFLRKKLRNEYPNSVFISAKNGEGIEQLDDMINSYIQYKQDTEILRIPMEMNKLIKFVHEQGDVIFSDLDLESNEVILEVKIDRDLLENIIKQIEKYRLVCYING